MSILIIMQNLRRLHDTRGRLKTIVGTLQTFQRAANFNPRRDGDWDILGQRDNRMTRINRNLAQVRSTTNSLRRATRTTPNQSRELSRLFMIWAQAYAEHGDGSRQADRAQSEYVFAQLHWYDDLDEKERQAQTTLREMRRHMAFYRAQEDLFDQLYRLAIQVVEFGGGGAASTQAFTLSQQFFQARNLCSVIAQNYASGIARAAEWQSALREAHRELSAWMRWSQNRRQVNRSLETQRAPH